jgi:nucleoside-diphosphate-sugar epimerase
MEKQILITGGAGFVGSHLADELLARGYRVRVLDELSAQVHGEEGQRPSYLSPDIELQNGDIRDPDAVRRALQGVDAVYHLAATVGVGQSMYEIARYTSVNNMGTAVLLEALIEKPVERLVVASSMSIYGEGLYRARTERWCGHRAQPAAAQRARLGTSRRTGRSSHTRSHCRNGSSQRWLRCMRFLNTIRNGFA